MTPPYVTKTIAKIGSSTDLEQRAVLAAELACYWARVGEFDEAQRLRAELRQDYGDGRSPQVSILIMCLEALLLYYKDLSPLARDRMYRANMLSNAFKQSRLSALTSAWMAHIDFNLNRIDTMAVHLQNCFKSLHADDGAALCRVSLVLGDAFLFAGNAAAARIWYEKARQAAVDLGDQAAVGAVTYNRAALHVSMARFRQLREVVGPDELNTIKTEVESAISYQAIANIKSLDHLLRTARAGVLMLNKMYRAAEPELLDLLRDQTLDATSSQAKLLRADLRVVCMHRGDVTGLREWIEAVPQDATAMANADDRALLFNAAYIGAAALEMADLQETFRSASAKAAEEHDTSVHELLARIGSFENG